MKKTPWLLKTYSADTESITDSLKSEMNELSDFSATTVNDLSYLSAYSNNVSSYINEKESIWGTDWDIVIQSSTSGKYDQSAFELLSGGFALKSAHSGSLTINGSTFDGSEDISINITTGVGFRADSGIGFDGETIFLSATIPDVSIYLTKASADTIYQPIGDYQTAGNYQKAGKYLTKTSADTIYQPIGDYQTAVTT